ncbi:effector-associated constant component EACC1 [Nocardia sp. FBN12]|uniref:effector-associated constant component EACC1 n=1 Tax=Nocardia sp. FBN12 TaxID=3419766 RepID=UPI003D05D199
MTDLNGQLTIRSAGGTDELFRLLEWFRNDDALRGRVGLPAPRIREGQLGDIYDVLVVAVGAGGLAPALVRSLNSWFTTRRSDIKLTLERDGVTVEVDAKRAKAPELVREIQNLLGDTDTTE